MFLSYPCPGFTKCILTFNSYLQGWCLVPFVISAITGYVILQVCVIVSICTPLSLFWSNFRSKSLAYRFAMKLWHFHVHTYFFSYTHRNIMSGAQDVGWRHVEKRRNRWRTQIVKVDVFTSVYACYGSRTTHNGWKYHQPWLNAAIPTSLELYVRERQVSEIKAWNVFGNPHCLKRKVRDPYNTYTDVKT